MSTIDRFLAKLTTVALFGVTAVCQTASDLPAKASVSAIPAPAGAETLTAQWANVTIPNLAQW